MKGQEPFIYKGNTIGLTIKDFWQFQYSNIWDMQEDIAEFLVAKALEIKVPFNRNGWTLWDIEYRGKKIEVKETGYFHSWRADGKVSKQRTFGITRAYTDYKNKESEYKRQSDIYVFCLNTGNTKEESNPLLLENWEFYVVRTDRINAICGNNKTISLGKVKTLSSKVAYANLKAEIDKLI